MVPLLDVGDQNILLQQDLAVVEVVVVGLEVVEQQQLQDALEVFQEELAFFHELSDESEVALDEFADSEQEGDTALLDG